ncbi:MAG: CerR family C-terminal domain-containing protein [Victivallales bacterium]|nr:CerR family C-terminal domain-containing protein [Victivallales bacterium]
MTDKREKIIPAALEEFVEHGYAGARIRRICDRAGVNLAAVNYYFGGKEELYRAVLEFSFQLPDPFDTIRDEMGRDIEPETLLSHLMVNFLRNTSTAGELYRYRFRLIVREMISPGDRFKKMFFPALRPRFALLQQLVAQVTGMTDDDPELLTATLLILAQCLFFFNKPGLTAVTGDADYGMNHAEAIARRIVRGLKV